MYSLAALAILLPGASASALKLASNLSGKSFMTGFSVNASLTDPTNYGNIQYVDSATATSSSNPLYYLNGAGNVVLKVDNATSDPNPGAYSTFGRNTVMVISADPIASGTLVAMDALHLPYGCSVWPSFWTLDTNNGTDAQGEIDIIETVNLKAQNQYSLHARNGCKLVDDSSFPHSGTDLYNDCNYDFNTTGNRGCSINEETSKNSVGEGFAGVGGGVYAMYWSTAGIQIWFFERSNIPADLTSETPDPSSWSAPSASFPASGCDPATYFGPQHLIINTDVCGAWAGSDAVFTTTGCSGKCADVVGTASNFDNAYWEIASVKTFTANGSASASASGTSTQSTSTKSGASASATAGSDSTSGASALSVGATLVLGLVAVIVGAGVA